MREGGRGYSAGGDVVRLVGNVVRHVENVGRLWKAGEECGLEMGGGIKSFKKRGERVFHFAGCSGLA